MIFHSYVKLPEGLYYIYISVYDIYDMCLFFWNVNTEHRETRGCKQKHGNAGKWRTQRARYLTLNFGWVILECFSQVTMYTHAVGMVHSKNEAEYVVCIAKTISVSYWNAWSLSYINHHVRKNGQPWCHRLKVVEVASKVDNWIHQNERQMRDSSKLSSKPCQLRQLYPQCHD